MLPLAASPSPSLPSSTVFLLQTLISYVYVKLKVSQTAQFNFLQTQLPLNLFEDFPVKSYAVYRMLQWASVSPDLETTVVTYSKLGVVRN